MDTTTRTLTPAAAIDAASTVAADRYAGAPELHDGATRMIAAGLLRDAGVPVPAGLLDITVPLATFTGASASAPVHAVRLSDSEVTVPCEGFDAPWNGFAVPLFTEAQLRAALATIAADDAHAPVITVTSGPGTLTLTSPEWEGESEVLTATEGGLYRLDGWCFEAA